MMGTWVLAQVRAQPGDELRCKGWKQETLLLMLENNLEDARNPSRLMKRVPRMPESWIPDYNRRE